MNVFEAVKQSVTTRQAAEHYGIHVGRNGMACCPFHNDKTPSMKLESALPTASDCGADGDVIDFTRRPVWAGKERRPPYNWHRTLGFPMRTGSRREKAKKAQAPAEIPGGTVSGGKEPMFPYSCRLSPLTPSMEKGICPALPGGSLSSPVCGSLTEASPSGISAGYIAARGDRGKKRL